MPPDELELLEELELLDDELDELELLEDELELELLEDELLDELLLDDELLEELLLDDDELEELPLHTLITPPPPHWLSQVVRPIQLWLFSHPQPLLWF